jgi:hypothetical protein
MSGSVLASTASNTSSMAFNVAGAAFIVSLVMICGCFCFCTHPERLLLWFTSLRQSLSAILVLQLRLDLERAAPVEHLNCHTG